MIDAPVAAVETAGRFVDGVYSSDAGTRRWRLWVPNGYQSSERLPLVVLLHGCTQDPDDLARGTRVTDHADRLRVLVLLPEQPASANVKKCWNWYDPAHQHRDAGEPALLAGATRQVMGEWSVDARRVYVAGISAGAAMASVMAVTYPDLFAAAGLHSGIPYGAASDVMQGVGAMANGAADTERLTRAALDAMGSRARSIPAIIVQGAADPVVKPINAVNMRDMWVRMNRRASGQADGSDARVRRTAATAGGLDYTRECVGPDADRCDVVVITVEGLGHAWSGGASAGTFTDERGPDATTLILDFLTAHSLPAAATGPNASRP